MAHNKNGSKKDSRAGSPANAKRGPRSRARAGSRSPGPSSATVTPQTRATSSSSAGNANNATAETDDSTSRRRSRFDTTNDFLVDSQSEDENERSTSPRAAGKQKTFEQILRSAQKKSSAAKKKRLSNTEFAVLSEWRKRQPKDQRSEEGEAEEPDEGPFGQPDSQRNALEPEAASDPDAPSGEGTRSHGGPAWRPDDPGGDTELLPLEDDVSGQYERFSSDPDDEDHSDMADVGDNDSEEGRKRSRSELSDGSEFGKGKRPRYDAEDSPRHARRRRSLDRSPRRDQRSRDRSPRRGQRSRDRSPRQDRRSHDRSRHRDLRDHPGDDRSRGSSYLPVDRDRDSRSETPPREDHHRRDRQRSNPRSRSSHRGDSRGRAQRSSSRGRGADPRGRQHEWRDGNPRRVRAQWELAHADDPWAPGPTWLTLAGGDIAYARRLFASFLEREGVSLGDLRHSQALKGVPLDRALEDFSLKDLDRLVESTREQRLGSPAQATSGPSSRANAAPSGAHNPATQQLVQVTMSLPLLNDLSPAAVATFCDQAMMQHNSGKVFSTAQVIHPDILEALRTLLPNLCPSGSNTTSWDTAWDITTLCEQLCDSFFKLC